MNHFYAYTRVSTQKQGEKGVSLQEQKAAIIRYAERHGLQIAEWFEERVTAAKLGRPLFTGMVTALRAGKAKGVIIHKIDRSARNLRDWSDLGDLIDSGVSVHFANESIDLFTRGGRLSADIQAVVASDYVRNLREETIKGMRGRLKQGLYPWGAPIGYLDTGGGKVKEIDPVRGPLVRQAFELYAAGGYSLSTLDDEMSRRGLATRSGRRVTKNGFAWMFKNPFYIGLIKVTTIGETFPGKHTPLVSTTLFRAVQDRLSGKTKVKTRSHDFLFRGLFKCGLCGRCLVGELQKGNVYYRCHTRGCSTKGFREETLEFAVLSSWPKVNLSAKQRSTVLSMLGELAKSQVEEQTVAQSHLVVQLTATKNRLARLIDAYVDGAVDKESFELRKRALLEDQLRLEEQVGASPKDESVLRQNLIEAFELACTAQHSYRMASVPSKRDLVIRLSSNRLVAGKEAFVEPFFPLSNHLNAVLVTCGGPDRTRTCHPIIANDVLYQMSYGPNI